ncbi:MAG TPA: hypothetical protein VHB70_07365 [Parafilimonas sp.]|nr:hypothetical protein [Parafilimonas sp.]
MKTASLAEVKQELQTLTAKEITDICLRLARFKKDNKELITYLLFEAHDIEAYTTQVKEMMNETFKDVNTNNIYLAKKTLRKILRLTNKHIKYVGSKQTEVELRIHFCLLLKNSGIRIHKNKVLTNMFLQQLKKIKVALTSLHEDIQYDFTKQLDELQAEV